MVVFWKEREDRVNDEEGEPKVRPPPGYHNVLEAEAKKSHTGCPAVRRELAGVVLAVLADGG